MLSLLFRLSRSPTAARTFPRSLSVCGRFNASATVLTTRLCSPLYCDRHPVILCASATKSPALIRYDIRQLRTCYALRDGDNDKKPKVEPDPPIDESDTSKMTLFQRFKFMWKRYWYVVVPVHVVTSLSWFGAFYYVSVSGVDIIAVLESLGVSETLLSPMKKAPSAGHIAIAYACYKLITPVRYTVTLGGTHVTIRILQNWGVIKPIPSTQKMKEIWEDRKDLVEERYSQFRNSFDKRKNRLLEAKKKTVVKQNKRRHSWRSRFSRLS